MMITNLQTLLVKFFWSLLFCDFYFASWFKMERFSSRIRGNSPRDKRVSFSRVLIFFFVPLNFFFFKSIGRDWWVSSRRNFLLRLFKKTPFRIWMLNLLTVPSAQCSEWRPLQSLGTVVGLLCEQEPRMHFMCWSWVLMLVCWATLPCLAAV